MGEWGRGGDGGAGVGGGKRSPRLTSEIRKEQFVLVKHVVTNSALQRQPSLSSICDPLSLTTSAFTQQYM